MRLTSLRLRLMAAGAVAVLGALTLAGFGFAWLFERHVERRAIAELGLHLDQIAAGLDSGAEGALVLLRPPADPRFARPLSGLYWQIEAGDTVLRSRSLWDGELPLPHDALLDGRPHEHVLAGPHGETLIALERLVTLGPRLGGQPARIAVAVDRAEIIAARQAFVLDLAPYLALLALALIAAAWAQVTVGLRPLDAVGRRVAALRAGAAADLGDGLPDEVRPLAAELDALLAARTAEVEKARTRAADLAHGLKTPLQALMGEAERLREANAPEAAAGIEEIALAMRRAVDRELARARISAAGRMASADPKRVARRVLSVVARTPLGAQLSLEIDAPEPLAARIDADDLTEALGALIENAARHADSAVTVSLAQTGDRVCVSVRDDGPGIPEDRLAAMTARGARLDSAGHGLGLSIAAEIAEAAGGTLDLRNAHPGLEARLTLPAAAT